MPANYVLLNRQTISSAVSTITFSNIPQTGYTDLKFMVSARSTANGGQNIYLQLNSISTGYLDKILSGTGSSVSSFPSGNTSLGCSVVVPGADFTANVFGNGEILLPNYSGSYQKSFMTTSVTENAATLSYIQYTATKVTNTAAISSVTFSLSSGNFDVGTSVGLYGIAALGTTPVTAPKATGGDIINNDGTYWYHVFLSSGVFTPSSNLSCQYLVIAGGGGGGSSLTGSYRSSGGGGAGGYRSSVTGENSGGGASAESAVSLLASNVYSVTIGGGGAGAIASSIAGSNGSDSSIFGGSVSITSTGGGKANDRLNSGGTTGGSGGGTYGGNATAGAGTANQGYASGVGNAADIEYWGGGGGGGAGSVGGNGSAGTISSGGGNGGNGVSSSITGTPVSRAGGGGAGRGGTASAGGGAGAGGNGNGSNGTNNTGGGGGGTGSFGGTSYTGGTGGSGIVIIRYAMA